MRRHSKLWVDLGYAKGGKGGRYVRLNLDIGQSLTFA